LIAKIAMAEDLPPLWLRLLPAKLRRKVEHRPNLLRALSNTGWLFGDKVLRMGIGLLVGVWVARYLGPEQFGLLNYAVALVALFGAIASAGLNGIVVRDLVNQPDTANETLGSSLALQLASGLVAFALAVLAIGFLRPDDPLARLVVAVLGFTLVFKASDVVRYWFEAQVQSRYVVWVENGVFLLLAAIKVGMILSEAPLMAFVWVSFAEALLVAVGLVTLVARRGGQLRVWRIRARRVRTLLADSWPLILSGLAVMVFMRTDQIMLGQMLGDDAVGIYSAAVRISEVWYFIPMAIVASVFPSLMQIRDRSVFDKNFQRLFDLMFVISFALALAIVVFANLIINVLYGSAYKDAAGILEIHAWVLVFAFMGVPSGRWYLYANLQNMALYRTLIGACLNILLNIILIPKYQLMGAAYATLAAIATSNVLFNAFSSHTQQLFMMQVRAIGLYTFRNGSRVIK
jgi:PST family polysaccharide transporter